MRLTRFVNILGIDPEFTLHYCLLEREKRKNGRPNKDEFDDLNTYLNTFIRHSRTHTNVYSYAYTHARMCKRSFDIAKLMQI